MKTRTGILALLVVAQVGLLLPGFASATNSPQESVSVFTGSRLIVRSDQASIRTVVVRGNLSAASISTSAYPTKSFSIQANSTQLYTLNFWLSFSSAYTAFIETRDPASGSTSQVTSYYVSSGDLNLTVVASFQPGPGSGIGPPLSVNSFYDWVAQFGNAFSPWVKVLYAILGVQFAFVGQRWMRFEDERRRTEGHLPPLDRGNKAYLWIDIAFRALLTGFVISLALMLGEVLILAIAQYLLFVNLSLFSHVDLFSLFFVAIVASMLYLTREGLDRFLDLKPMIED